MRLPQGFLDRAKAEVQRRAVKVLKNIGEACVAEAVANGNYTDQTGNLRSSIGYVICKDGVIVDEGGFWNVGGSEGPTAGRAKAQSLAVGATGLVLIIVAGMQYAQYVADKGFNVLDSAELLAHRLASQLRK